MQWSAAVTSRLKLVGPCCNGKKKKRGQSCPLPIELSTTQWKQMENGDIVPPFIISAVDEHEWTSSHSGRFTTGEGTTGTFWIMCCDEVFELSFERLRVLVHLLCLSRC
jgi:hypothetical protein